MNRIDWGGVRVARENLRRLTLEHTELTCRPSEANHRGWEADLEEVMSRTRSMGETTQVAFRLPVDLVERLDRHLERVRLRAAGIGITRADVVRNLLSVALDREEAAEAKAPRPDAARKRPARAEKTYPRIPVKR